MQAMGVNTLICTDISRDGAMGGANRALYERLTKELRMRITASGGVSTLSDVEYLASLGCTAAIVGKAYYTGDIDLRAALEAAK
jgi:phosphoribosylformimino-5-aminoimidazole carboxamide ribotide isomerase